MILDFLFNKFVPGVVIAIITALVTVRLSIKRFHSEQWWLRKAESYSKIVESLHLIKVYCEDQLEYIEMREELPKNIEQELQKEIKKSLAEIRKAVDIGSFFISLEAEKTLTTLWAEIEMAKTEPSFYEYLNVKLKGVDKALKSIKLQGIKDLGVMR